MLTDDQKRLIAEHAALATRLSWGHVNPRSLGDLVADVTERIAAGTLTTPTFAEYADALHRSAHAERVYKRDAAFDALLDHEPELRRTLRQIEEMQGPEGVVSFAASRRIDVGHCAQLLEEDGRPAPPVREPELALGD